MENLYAEAKKVAFLGSDKCIQELFEAQVERTPSSIALIVDDQEVTYQSLNDQANELAHYLIIKGVKPNALVGICCEPSVHMVIGLLGILKAGGAYVPLDPSYPLMRLNQMREDSNFVTIITQEKFIGDLIEEGEAICIDNKAFKDHINALPRENIKTSSIRLKSKDLAYVIFTSGSSGKPK